MTNITIDLCHYLLNGNSMLVDFFLDDVKNTSNIVHECPFKVKMPTRPNEALDHWEAEVKHDHYSRSKRFDLKTLSNNCCWISVVINSVCAAGSSCSNIQLITFFLFLLRGGLWYFTGSLLYQRLNSKFEKFPSIYPSGWLLYDNDILYKVE